MTRSVRVIASERNFTASVRQALVRLRATEAQEPQALAAEALAAQAGHAAAVVGTFQKERRQAV